MSGQTKTVRFGSGRDGHALVALPCAALSLTTPVEGCTGRGIRPCSKCRLVSYCSTACQSSHWKRHKHQCNSEYLQDTWTTQYQREKRMQTAAMPKGYYERPTHYIWGNIFAYDCLNLAHNEGVSSNQDLTICLAASGDLRNAIMTVNSLPEGYSGTCRILINDRDTVVAGRNAFILNTLESVGTADIDEIAELCFHLSYSAALTQGQYKFLTAGLDSLFGDRSRIDITKTFMRQTRNVSMCFSLTEFLGMTMSTFDWAAAKQKMHNIILDPDPAWNDMLHAMLFPLRPAHRLAEMHYRQTGVVLPFGAPTGHFTYPNRLLFHGNGEWIPPVEQNLISGWDTHAVTEYGKAHGYTSEDLYGCFFAYVTNQFAQFARRMQKMKIELAVTSFDASALAQIILTTDNPVMGRPFFPSVQPLRFDRVETSNIMDFVTTPDMIVKTWSPLLNRTNPHSTLLMYTMNWGESTPGATVTPSLDPSTMPLVRSACAYSGFEVAFSDTSNPVSTAVWHWVNSFYDHESAFEAYLERRGIRKSASRVGLELKERNTIIPKRLGFPLEGSSDNLPHFSKEEWYFVVMVAKRFTIHRYLEVGIPKK